jgi:DNA-binding IscR family transcriptional regulator
MTRSSHTHRTATPDLLLAAVTACGDEGALPSELSDDLGIPVKTLRDAWTKLRAKDVVHSRRGRWYVGGAPMKLV